jgi:hypothetical protein
MLAAVDKAIQSAGLNLNPTNLGQLLLSMPALTEETRKGFTKQAAVLLKTPVLRCATSVAMPGRPEEAGQGQGNQRRRRASRRGDIEADQKFVAQIDAERRKRT